MKKDGARKLQRITHLARLAQGAAVITVAGCNNAGNTARAAPTDDPVAPLHINTPARPTDDPSSKPTATATAPPIVPPIINAPPTLLSDAGAVFRPPINAPPPSFVGSAGTKP